MKTSTSISRRSMISGAVAAACIGLAPMRAHAVWWSTEWTQIANNVELVASYAAQVEMVSTQIDQYITMLKNLEKMADYPKNLIDSVTSPIRKAMASIQKLKDSVTQLGEAAKSVGTTWQRQLTDMTQLKLKPEAYYEQERQLANKRGGIYKAQWDKDLASLQELQDNASNVRDLANKIPGINGNIQGLQLLTTHTNQLLQETTEMRALMTRASANTLQDRMDTEQEKIDAAERAKKNVTILKARTARDAGWKSTFKAPWEE